jgi:hypothetical protein
MIDARRNGNFHRCTICGAEFMLRSTMLRHFYLELDGFRKLGAMLRAEYEEERFAYRKLNPDRIIWSIKKR